MPIPDFVVALRSHMGTELLWMPGVSAVVVHEDGRLLLGRRADNGLWAVVSGSLEPGEQPALAAVREVLETEMRLDLADMESIFRLVESDLDVSMAAALQSTAARVP